MAALPPEPPPDEDLEFLPLLGETPVASAGKVAPAEAAHPVPTAEDTFVEQPLVPELAEDPPGLDTDSPSPAEDDVGWMTLPGGDEPQGAPVVTWLDPVLTSSPGAPRTSAGAPRASAGAPRTILDEAPRPPRSPAALTLAALLIRWIASLPRGMGSLVRRAGNATRAWPASWAASAYAALIRTWTSVGRSEKPAPTSPGERTPLDSVGSGVVAPLSPRPSGGAPPAERVAAEARVERRHSPAIYNPRTSSHDGLPVLELEPLDDESGASTGPGAEASADDLPDIVLEPLDEPPASRAAHPPGPEESSAYVRSRPVAATSRPTSSRRSG